MNKIFTIVLTAICCAFMGCSSDEWGNGDPALEHVYYFGFENWGEAASGTFNKNGVVYNVNRDATLNIPVQFHSERVRSYDVVVYYYVSGASADMKRGIDYNVVDDNGAILTPDAKGAFTMTYSQAKKGVKNIHIKALNAAIGSFDVLTFDPNAGPIAHPDNIINSKTNDYEVRSFLLNYKVKVNIK